MARTSVDVLTSWDEAAALRTEWGHLADQAEYPLSDFGWFDACNEALKGGADLRIIVAREGGSVAAIAPLAIDRSSTPPRLRTLDYFTFEASRFPGRDNAALKALFEAIVRLGFPAEIRRLREGGPEIEVAREMRHPRGLALTPLLQAPTARVLLSKGWSSVEQAMSKGSRSYIRRKRRIAERSGMLRLDVTSPDEATVDVQLAEVFRVEANGWKSRAGTAVLSDERMRRFLIAYGRHAARKGTLRLYFLKLGDATIAVRMAVEAFNRIWELKIGFDERWANCSPGILLANESLRHACDKGLEAFEFLGVSAPWQSHWPVEYTHYRRFFFYPYAIGGARSLISDATEIASRRMKRRLAEMRGNRG